MTLARASRDHEHVTAGYVDLRGNDDRTAGSSPTNWSPPAGAGTCCASTATATTGAACGWTGCPTSRALRHHVHAAGGARRGRLRAARRSPPRPYRYVARVRYFALEGVCRADVLGRPRSRSRRTGPTRASSPRAPTTPSGWCRGWRMPGVDFEVLEPPEVVAAVRTVAERLRAQPADAPSAPRPSRRT